MAEPITGVAGVCNSIYDLLVAETAPGKRIVGAVFFDGEITNGQAAPTDDKARLIPYGTVTFGGKSLAQISHRGITSVRDDLKNLLIGVSLYAYNARELRDFIDAVSDVLEGFEPVNAGEISIMNSGRIENPADVKQNHPREGMGLIFTCKVNTITANTL